MTAGEGGAAAAAHAARQFSLAAGRGDIELLMTCVHPDVTIRQAPGMPYREVYEGRQGILDLWTDVGALLEFPGELQLEVHGVSGELAVTYLQGAARAKATGVEFPLVIVEWVTVRDGLVADSQVFYWDQAPVLGVDRHPGDS